MSDFLIFFLGLVAGWCFGYPRGRERRAYTRLDVISLDEYRAKRARQAAEGDR